MRPAARRGLDTETVQLLEQDLKGILEILESHD